MNIPHSLPLQQLDVGRLIRKVGPANAAIARYDGLLQSVVNPSVMLSPLTNQEAVLSSRIEGTQATVDEVLEYDRARALFPDDVIAWLQESQPDAWEAATKSHVFVNPMRVLCVKNHFDGVAHEKKA